MAKTQKKDKKEVKKQDAQPEEKKTVEKTTGDAYFEAVGRRREASARIRLYVVDESGKVEVAGEKRKKGEFIVNDRPVDSYFPGKVYERMYQEPLRTTNAMDRFFISVKVVGGGLSGQLGAVTHGLSRALVKVDGEKFRPILKKRGFLTRDARAKERRKAGLAQSARAKKQSPKR